jgi:hypothetical protein
MGMLVSACISVRFGPAFFVVLQRVSERRGRKDAATGPAAPPRRQSA